jgi:murein DD-endopeptidase MepM/ murein hydrolase activator NlpD
LLGLFAPLVWAQSLFVDSHVEGAWYDPAISGQGLMIEALPGGKQLFVAWFTFAPDESGSQRWYSAVLTLNGATATGRVHRTLGGRLATVPTAAQQQNEIGSMTIDFPDCRTAAVTYSLADDAAARSGSFVATPARELVPGAPGCTAVTKLRWPHASPALDDAAYARLEADLWIPNNFGMHQGGSTDRPGDLYIHDGIDVYAANGSMIYALEPGRVRSISNAGQGMTVTVESAATPGEGWAYTHIVPVVANGAIVAQGDALGTVQFTGIEHLHLSRVRKPATAAGWDYVSLLNLNPAGFFSLPDSEPPVFRNGLIFLHDLTETPFADGAPVSGKVDIVAGIRDPGPHARRNLGGPVPWGDHHAVMRVDYDIEGQGIKTVHRGFDFNLLEIGRPEPSVWSMAPAARVVFQPILLAPVSAGPERSFNYYRLTNGTGGSTLAVIDGLQSWDTASRDAAGNRNYPDGTYTITVRASDSSGNLAQYADTVEVRND